MTARLSLAFVGLAAFTLGVAAFVLMQSARSQALVASEANLRRHVESIASLMGSHMEEVALSPAQRKRIAKEMTRLSGEFQGRMCIVNWKGEVLEDSDTDPQAEKQVRHHPEVYEALNGRYGSEVREGELFVAVAMLAGGKTQGAIYASRPLTEIDLLMGALRKRLVYAGAAALFLASLLSFLLGRFLTKPVKRLAEGVQRISEGDYDHRLSLRRKDELGSLAADVDRMAENLTEQRRILLQFVSDASHELKTPVASLKALSESLSDGALEEPQLAKRFVGFIASEVQRMETLVQNLLCLQRLESGAVSVRMEPFCLVTLARELLEPMTFAQHLVRIEGPEGLEVLGDRDSLAQVLTNLVSNALQYSENVILSFENRSPELALVAVTDDGPGLPTEELERVFERFYRTEQARSREGGGNGLGLAICREIMASHGQKIWLENQEGGGLRACFTLAKDPS